MRKKMICLALALVLAEVKLFTLPQSGSVTPCSMLFIALIGYWYGARAGVLAGVTCGLLRILLGAYIIHPIQFALDYPLAYGALGLAGLFRGPSIKNLYIGFCVGVLGLFLCHFIAGVVFFGSFAPAGQNVFLYSAIYNGTFTAAEAALTLVLISLPPIRAVINHLR